jgi:hypothetical protein
MPTLPSSASDSVRLVQEFRDAVQSNEVNAVRACVEKDLALVNQGTRRKWAILQMLSDFKNEKTQRFLWVFRKLDDKQFKMRF